MARKKANKTNKPDLGAFQVPRGRPRPKAEEIEAFAIGSEPEETTPEPPQHQSQAAKGSRLRRANRGERMTAYVPPELHEKVRIRCAQERRSLSDAVTEALREWMSSQ